MSEQNSEKKMPVFRQKVSTVEASVWENEGKEGSFFSVSMQRSYKDGEEWKTTQTLRINDIPAMIVALKKCYEYTKIPKKDE